MTRLILPSVVLAAIAAVGLAFWGWWLHFQPLRDDEAASVLFGEALYRALRVFTSAELYMRGQSGEPRLGDAGITVGENTFATTLLEIARWLGLTVTAAAILRALVAVLATPLNWARASLRFWHVVAIGDHAITRRFAELHARWWRGVTHHCSDPESDWDNVLSLPRPSNPLSPWLKRSVAGAKRIVVSQTDDDETLETALQLATFNSRRPVIAIVEDAAVVHAVRPLLSDAKGAGALRIVSRTAASARAVHRAHPPILEARARGCQRVHVLLSGFGDLGATLLRDLINASVLPNAPWPMATILDPDGDEKLARFRALHPGLDETRTPISVIPANADELTPDNIERLRAASVAFPVTGVYVTQAGGRSALRAAMLLSEIARREGIFQAKVFVDAPETALPKNGSLVSFGALDDVVRAAGLLRADPDAAARAFHEVYRAAGSYTAADQPWDSLEETYRVSNRRILAHLPTKLSAAGFDLSSWSTDHSATGVRTITLRPEEPLYRNATEWVRLAEVEHERWMADRFLDGWRFDEVRDNTRKRHNCLRPFAELQPEIQQYDLQSVLMLAKSLKTSRRGLTRPADASLPEERPQDRALVERFFPGELQPT